MTKPNAPEISLFFSLDEIFSIELKNDSRSCKLLLLSNLPFCFFLEFNIYFPVNLRIMVGLAALSSTPTLTPKPLVSMYPM